MEILNSSIVLPGKARDAKGGKNRTIGIQTDVGRSLWGTCINYILLHQHVVKSK